jgi:DNA-binding Xre family transcriptional regulator
MNTPELLRNRVRIRMGVLGMTNRDLAQALNLSVAQVKIMFKSPQTATLDKWMAVCDILGCDIVVRSQEHRQ